MIIVTTPTITNKTIIEEKGLVAGSVIQSRNSGRSILSRLKSIIGGELKSYTRMMEDAKKMAKERMAKEAESMGANAIVGFRFALTSGESTTELIAYGTAVILK